MAAFLTLDCPHCLTRSSSFELRGENSISKKPSRKVAYMMCRTCELGVVVELFDQRYNPIHGHRERTLGSTNGDLLREEYVLVNVWPSLPPKSDAPAYTPSNVAHFFIQAEENLKSKHFDAAGGMFRKALDVATKDLDQNLKSQSLYKRIEALSANGRITPELGDWAHEIRLDGNSAVHDEDPFTIEQAVSLGDFTKLFLQYVFTMPGMLAAKRNPQGSEQVDN